MKPGNPAPIHFTLSAPAQILVSFFRHDGTGNGPENADAENWNPVLFNSVAAKETAPLTVWAKPLPAGENELDLGRTAGVVLGFVPQDLHILPHAVLSTTNGPANLDWLFEN